MKRYYYDDPLAAAWMHQKHNICYTDSNGAKLSYCYVEGCIYRDGDDGSAYDGKFYIHPDSLLILEPMDKDIGIDVSGVGVFFLDGRWRQYNLDYDYVDGDSHIIQRNGMAFMWPESEEV